MVFDSSPAFLAVALATENHHNHSPTMSWAATRLRCLGHRHGNNLLGRDIPTKFLLQYAQTKKPAPTLPIEERPTYSLTTKGHLPTPGIPPASAHYLWQGNAHIERHEMRLPFLSTPYRTFCTICPHFTWRCMVSASAGSSLCKPLHSLYHNSEEYKRREMGRKQNGKSR